MRKFSPPEMPDAEVSAAVALIKAERPDLWRRWVDHEKLDEGYADIGDEILRLLTGHFTTSGAKPKPVHAQKRPLSVRSFYLGQVHDSARG